MIVKNLNGTTNNKCNCGSWINHWNNYSGQTTKKCVVKGCDNLPEVGGHVQKNSASDKSWYIIPICKSCNGLKGQELDVIDKVKLVSANVSNTCG